MIHTAGDAELLFNAHHLNVVSKTTAERLFEKNSPIYGVRQ